MRLIDANMLINEFDQTFLGNNPRGVIRATIESAPTIEERKKGKWIGKHERKLFSHPDSITYECSECGYSIYTIYGMPETTNFCPNCGSYIGGDTDE